MANVAEVVPVPAAGSSSTAAPTDAAAAAPAVAKPAKPTYPLKVSYCRVCTLPAEVHDYVSRSQFTKCSVWLRTHAPELFPDVFPEEAAARLERLALVGDDAPEEEDDDAENDGGVRVAIPIEQKTSGGKKKKAPAEIHLALGQRKGKKQVTIVYGLDLFGIKLKDAAKAAKRKFATGSSVTTSADSRDVIEIQGARQEDFAHLVHKEFGVRVLRIAMRFMFRVARRKRVVRARRRAYR
eukprot:IDg2539t1